MLKIYSIYQETFQSKKMFMHQLQVTHLVSLIEQSWVGPIVDFHKVKIAALVHDLGKLAILKPPFSRDLACVDAKNEDEFEQFLLYRTYLSTKYADFSSCDAVTEQMLIDVGFAKRGSIVLQEYMSMIQGLKLGNEKTLLEAGNWETLILLFADMRATSVPKIVEGEKYFIVSYEERLRELINTKRLPSFLLERFTSESSLVEQIEWGRFLDNYVTVESEWRKPEIKSPTLSEIKELLLLSPIVSVVESEDLARIPLR
jgi:hypothetical protein